MSEPRYYDWSRIMTRDAPINIIISSRGLGKTYGLRMQFINDYLKGGYRFVEVTRTKTEQKELIKEYFDKVGEEYPGYEFKTEANRAYIQRVENKKHDWKLIGYFVAFTELQTAKKRTFKNVRRIGFDEAIIERIDRYHSYLPHEWELLASIIDSCTRERADDDSVKPHVYLLGNACDLVNPWFRALRIDRKPKTGMTWHANKLALLHYVEPGEYERRKLSETLSGQMLALVGGGKSSLRNDFENANMDFVSEKTRGSKIMFGISYDKERYGIWEDKKDGRLYVNRKIPNGTKPVYALTARDGRADLVTAKKAEPMLKMVVNLFYLGCVLYDSPYTRERFFDILKLFGVR